MRANSSLLLLFFVSFTNILCSAFSRSGHISVQDARHITDSKQLSVTRLSQKRLNRISLSSKGNDDSCSSSEDFFYVRKARYMELGSAVDVLIDAFYKPSALVRPYLYLSELSRVQGNFPYDENVHSFFVACCTENDEEKIIGFVDVDKRPGKKISDAPRPYLSDLAVHSRYRRRGVAKALIHRCENAVKDWGEDHLHLRVDKENHGALKMYEDLMYESQEHPYFGHGRDKTILLKREFSNNTEKLKVDEKGKSEQSLIADDSITYVI